MRKPVALVLATALLATLAGCSANSGRDSDCTPLAPSGDASSVVKAAGSFDSAPDVTFPTPLVADSTERTVVVEGDGEVVRKGDVALVEISLLDGASGQVLQKSSYDGEGALIMGVNSTQAIGIEKGLTCSRVGDRVAVVIPKAEGFATAQGDDSVVLVADILATFPGRSEAPAVASPNGFPNIVYGEDGRPGVEVAGATPPAEFKVATLRQGDGPEVEEGQAVLVQYTAVVWNTREVFQSTWDVGRAGTAIATSAGTVAEGSFPGLVGQRVGSQYVAVVPPEYGFGSTATSAVPANSTLIWVVDILGVLPGS